MGKAGESRCRRNHLMAATSELVTLYRITFDEEPSAEMIRLLLRMEKVLSLTQDDPLARILIVQLRVADLMQSSVQEAVDSLTTEISDLKKTASEFYDLRRELKKLADTVSSEHSRRSLVRITRRSTWAFQPVNVEIRDISFPILEYLRNAFDRRENSPRPEYVGSARMSLFFVLAMGGLLVFAGMAVQMLRG
jgi:hypothetical protein